MMLLDPRRSAPCHPSDVHKSAVRAHQCAHSGAPHPYHQENHPCR